MSQFFRSTIIFLSHIRSRTSTAAKLTFICLFHFDVFVCILYHLKIYILVHAAKSSFVLTCDAVFHELVLRTEVVLNSMRGHCLACFLHSEVPQHSSFLLTFVPTVNVLMRQLAQ